MLSSDTPAPEGYSGTCYKVPKSCEDTRTMTHSCFEDAIAMVALLQGTRNLMQPSSPPASFGNVLNPQMENEYLYRYFLHQHRDFKKAVSNTLAPGGYVTCADVWKYYDTIKLDELYYRIKSLLGDRRPRTLSAWKRYLLTCASYAGVVPDTGNESNDCGIPQGHPTSGALANIYLHQLDQHMWSKEKWPGRFFRYVDDMRAVSTPEQDNKAALEEIDGVISESRFGLKLNQSKSRCYPFSAHEDDLRDDLNELSNRCHTLIRCIYRLPDDYASAFREDQWQFCCE